MKVVTLSTGEQVTLQGLSWNGYKAFRGEFIQAIARPLSTHTLELLIKPLLDLLVQKFAPHERQGINTKDVAAWWSDDDTRAVIATARAQFERDFESLLADAVTFFDTAAHLLLKYSVGREFDLDSLTLTDGLLLRNEVLTLTDLRAIWELEKNFAGELRALMATMIGDARSRLPHGGTA